MSVSKIRHDSFAFDPSDAGSARRTVPLQIRENITAVPPQSEAGEFWTQLNVTLDDFFRTINASKEHIKRLANELAERDQRIEMLCAENAALRDQLESSTEPAERTVNENPKPVLAPPRGDAKQAPAAPPSQPHSRRSIWSRLSGFDEPTPLEDREF